MVDMIQINDLKFSYPDGSAALRGVSLSVKPGEFVTLCGLSGCGKSTLLRLMKPGLFPRGELSGDVRFLGRKLTSEPDRDAAAKIGFVMQDPEAQTVTDKVWHELAFSCESVGMERNEIRRRVGEMAGYFGLEELSTSRPTRFPAVRSSSSAWASGGGAPPGAAASGRANVSARPDSRTELHRRRAQAEPRFRRDRHSRRAPP